MLILFLFLEKSVFGQSQGRSLVKVSLGQDQMIINTRVTSYHLMRNVTPKKGKPLYLFPTRAEELKRKNDLAIRLNRWEIAADEARDERCRTRIANPYEMYRREKSARNDAYEKADAIAVRKEKAIIEQGRLWYIQAKKNAEMQERFQRDNEELEIADDDHVGWARWRRLQKAYDQKLEYERRVNNGYFTPQHKERTIAEKVRTKMSRDNYEATKRIKTKLTPEYIQQVNDVYYRWGQQQKKNKK